MYLFAGALVAWRRKVGQLEFLPCPPPFFRAGRRVDAVFHCVAECLNSGAAATAFRMRWASALLIALLLFAPHPVYAKAAPKPRIIKVPLARVPWQRQFSHPTPIFIPLMTLPWADCHVVALHIPHPRITATPQNDPDCHFIMAMCTDHQGNLWLATEGAGVFRYDPAAPKGQRWKEFTKQNTHGTLQNNCIYAIACDNHNRIWAGELNHGISVFNGKRWQDYDMVQNPKHHVLAGPLGNHVYAMQFDHYTDQMWICTENGISIYQCQKATPASRAVDPPGSRPASVLQPHHHRWHYITQADGLPMNPDSIAFASNGLVLVGTQCSGVAIGTPRQGNISVPGDALGWSHYQWSVIKGPWHMPLTATGNGLPGNLINSVTTTWPHHLAVATDEGIALGKCVGVPQSAATAQSAMFSRGPGARASSAARTVSSLNIHLTFEHGQNFVAKVHGLWHPPAHWNPPPGRLLAQLPTEDHTTVVAWQPAGSGGKVAAEGSSSTGKAGYLWLGHWRTGLDVWQYNAQGRIINLWQIHRPQVGNYIQSLLPLKGGAMAVGCYGAGVRIITLPGQSNNAWRQASVNTDSNNKNAIIPSEPQGAKPPSARQLTAMANAIRSELIKSKGQKQPRIVPLPDDWRTEGNWLGRYGKYWIDLAAVCSPYDFVWGTNESSILYAVSLAHPVAGDEPRYWVQTLQTANPRALELPKPYMESREKLFHVPANLDRRDASTDDHGEACAYWRQGPGLYIELNVPAGPFIFSVYEWDDNGHGGTARYRDYRLDLRPHPYMESFESERDFSRVPRAAMGRSQNFYGGVWKRFMVFGPGKIAVRISRNHSLNTIFSGAALDPLDQYCPPYFDRSAPRVSTVAYTPHLGRPWGAAPTGFAAAVRACNRVFRCLAASSEASPAVASRWVAAYAFLARVYQRCTASFAQSKSASLGADKALAICEWSICQFRHAERIEEKLGVVPARRIEESLRWNGNSERQVDEDGTEVRAWRHRRSLMRPAPKFSF